MNVLTRCGVRGLPSALFVLAITAAAPASAQVRAAGLDPYRHTYDPEHGYVPVPVGDGRAAYGGGYGYGGYGGYGGGYGFGAGATAAGMGQAAAGVGQMHLENAQAAGAYADAVNQHLQNKGLAMEVLQQNAAERRQADDQYEERAKAQDRAQVELYKKSMAQMSAAHRLTAEQFDFQRGVLHWPFCLRGPEFQEQRTALDRLFDARTPADSGTNSSGYSKIVAACQAMQAILKKDVQAGMPVTDFVTADHFISSVEYEAQFPVKAPQAGPPGQAGAAAGGE